MDEGLITPFVDLTGGTLSKILPLHATNIVFLVGGGRNPRYPPNKVIFWDEALGKEVVELEFREQVRGLACRRGLLAVALARRVVLFDVLGDKVVRRGEWETCENKRGENSFVFELLSVSLREEARDG